MESSSSTLGLEQIPGQAGAVDIDEGLVGPGTVRVQPAREHTLSGPRFAADEDGALGSHHSLGVLGQPPNGRACSGEGIELVASRSGRAGQLPPANPLRFQEALQHDQQGGKFDRLGEEMVCSVLDAMDARFGAGGEYERHLRMLRDQVTRLSDLMRELLEYGRPSSSELHLGSGRMRRFVHASQPVHGRHH
jgi:hypothetical protein